MLRKYEMILAALWAMCAKLPYKAIQNIIQRMLVKIHGYQREAIKCDAIALATILNPWLRMTYIEIPRWAIPRTFLKVGKKILVSGTKPNNSIKYKVGEKDNYAIIEQIYQFKNPIGQVDYVLKVFPVHNRYPKDLHSNTWFFRKLCYLLKVVVGTLDKETTLVSLGVVTGVAAYCLLPHNTFNIPESEIIIRPYDYDLHLSVIYIFPLLMLFFSFFFFFV